MEHWYYDTFAPGVPNNIELLDIIRDSHLRPEGWIPDWDQSAFNTAQEEFRRSDSEYAMPYLCDDPRDDYQWRDASWDDILVPQWWRYVYSEYVSAKVPALLRSS